MRLKNFFFPPEDITNKLSYRDHKKVGVLITGNIICTVMFFIFSIALLGIQKILTGSLMSVLVFLFILSLFIIKKGKIILGSYVTTIGLIFACFVIAFFTSHVSHPVVSYRTVCFCVAVANLNFMISLKKGQLRLFLVFSIILLIASTFVLHFPEEFMSDPKEWISGVAINIIAIATANVILLASDKSNEEIVSHSEKEHDQVVQSLETITNVLGQVQESVNVGEKLNVAADSASTSVDSIQELYQILIAETEKLNQHSVVVLDSSQVVNVKTENMANSIQEQNSSIAEISSAVTEISANISNINSIAEKRRSGMVEVTELLNSQSKLINLIVENVKKVENSSERIAEFVNTVDRIAKQTNLLAMNASIEAAHSGENGKGFGVIAQEIRKLSEETAVNARNISETLTQNTEIVKETSESVEAFASSNQRTEDEIRATFTSMEEILHGITEMDSGSQEIMRSVRRVVDTTNESTHIIEEVVSHISNQSDGINDITAATNSLKERVSAVSDMLPAISQAIEQVHLSAKESEEVSSKIAELLK